MRVEFTILSFFNVSLRDPKGQFHKLLPWQPPSTVYVHLFSTWLKCIVDVALVMASSRWLKCAVDAALVTVQHVKRERRTTRTTVLHPIAASHPHHPSTTLTHLTAKPSPSHAPTVSHQAPIPKLSLLWCCASPGPWDSYPTTSLRSTKRKSK